MTGHHLEFILLCAYLSFGPQAWGLYGALMIAGRRKMLLMKRPAHPLKGTPPSVTILVPAKDEEARIRGCIDSILQQDYSCFDAVAIDDRSEDGTGRIMDEMAWEKPNLRVFHVVEPPGAGWTGKNNALHQGASVARGEWLLFVDSDVVLCPDALSVAMSVVLRKEFDLLSLLPRLESHTLWESLLVPLAGGAATSMYLVPLTNNSMVSTDAFANGQFLLIKRSAYDTIGGHETVRDRYCEDVEIARLVQAAGLRPRVSWGADFASVRMYSSVPAIIRGWSRIYYAARVGSPWRVLAASAFIIFCCFSAYAALAWGVYRLVHSSSMLWGYGAFAWLLAGGLHLALMMRYLGLLYTWSGNPRRNAWLFPVAGSMLLYIFLRALRMCVTKKVEWRGTAYSHTMASKLASARR